MLSATLSEVAVGALNTAVRVENQPLEPAGVE
jgi:hypothetical protein